MNPSSQGLPAVLTHNPCSALIECIREHREHPRSPQFLLAFEKNVDAMSARLDEIQRADRSWRRPSDDVVRERIFRFYDALKDDDDALRRESLFNATFQSLMPRFYDKNDDVLWGFAERMERPGLETLQSKKDKDDSPLVVFVTRDYWVPRMVEPVLDPRV